MSKLSESNTPSTKNRQNMDYFTDFDKKTSGSLLITNNLAPPTWIPDDDIDDCMVCTQQFSTFTRKHHCRQCGFVVCHNCSTKRAKLAHTSKPVRVCDRCSSDLSLDIENKENEGVNQPVFREVPLEIEDSPEGSVGIEDADVELLSIVDVPSWTYAFKSFSKQGQNIRIGRIAIKIKQLNNVNIPLYLADASHMTSVITVTCGKRVISSSPVTYDITNSPSYISIPVDKDLLIDVTSAASPVKIHHSLVVSSDDFLPSPILSSSHPSPIQTHKGDVIVPMGYVTLDLPALYSQYKQDKTSLSLALSETPSSQVCVMDLDVQYVCQPTAHILTQFFDEDSHVTDPDNMAFTTRYPSFASLFGDLVYILYSVSPLITLINTFPSLISWHSEWSAFTMLISIPIVFIYPQAFVLFLYCRFLLFLIFAYMAKYSGASPTPSPHSIASTHVTDLASIVPNPIKQTVRKESPGMFLQYTFFDQTVHGSVKDLHLTILLTDFLEAVLPLCGYSDLRVVDEQVARFVSSYRQYYSFFSWDKPFVTASIFIAASFSLTHVIITSQYITLYLLLLLVLTWNSVVMKVVRVGTKNILGNKVF